MLYADSLASLVAPHVLLVHLAGCAFEVLNDLPHLQAAVIVPRGHLLGLDGICHKFLMQMQFVLTEPMHRGYPQVLSEAAALVELEQVRKWLFELFVFGEFGLEILL